MRVEPAAYLLDTVLNVLPHISAGEEESRWSLMRAAEQRETVWR
jgi:hypothetical protein